MPGFAWVCIAIIAVIFLSGIIQYINNSVKEDEKERQKLAKIQSEANERFERRRQRDIEYSKRASEMKKALREPEKKISVQRRFIAQQRRLMSDSLRYDVLRRDGFRCQICGATQKDGVRLHVDHIYPVSKGGRTEMSNLRTLCERCNMGKRDKIEIVENRNIS